MTDNGRNETAEKEPEKKSEDLGQSSEKAKESASDSFRNQAFSGPNSDGKPDINLSDLKLPGNNSYELPKISIENNAQKEGNIQKQTPDAAHPNTEKKGAHQESSIQKQSPDVPHPNTEKKGANQEGSIQRQSPEVDNPNSDKNIYNKAPDAAKDIDKNGASKDVDNKVPDASKYLDKSGSNKGVDNKAPDGNQIKEKMPGDAKNPFDKKPIESPYDKKPVDPSILQKPNAPEGSFDKKPVDPSILQKPNEKNGPADKHDKKNPEMKDPLNKEIPFKKRIDSNFIPGQEQKDGGIPKGMLNNSELGKQIGKQDSGIKMPEPGAHDLKNPEAGLKQGDNIDSTLKDLGGQKTSDNPNETNYLKGAKGPGGEGEHKIPTGDKIKRDKDGKETLTTPNGDRLTVNPDGTYTTKGNVKSITSNREGNERTVTFADGSQVTFGRDGIRQVARKEKTVNFVTPKFEAPEQEDPMDKIKLLKR